MMVIINIKSHLILCFYIDNLPVTPPSALDLARQTLQFNLYWQLVPRRAPLHGEECPMSCAAEAASLQQWGQEVDFGKTQHQSQASAQLQRLLNLE